MALALAVAATIAAAVRSAQTLSFTGPFDLETMDPSGRTLLGWQLGGSAKVDEEYLTLTPPEEHRRGWLWSAEAVRLESFQLEVEMYIGGSEKRGAGGGLGIWFTENKGMDGPIYGHSEDFKGLGLLFDTLEGDEDGDEGEREYEPFVVGTVSDGLVPKGGRVTDEKHQVGICFAHYRNKPYPIKVRLTLRLGRLHVGLSLDGRGRYSSCFTTTLGDVRVKSIPSTAFLGITADTGEYGDAHTIYAVTVTDLSPSADDSADEPELPHVPENDAQEGKVAVGKEAEQRHKQRHPGPQVEGPHAPVEVPTARRPVVDAGGSLSVESRLQRLEQQIMMVKADHQRMHTELMGQLRASANGLDKKSVGSITLDLSQLKDQVAALGTSLENQMQVLKSAVEHAEHAREGSGDAMDAIAEVQHSVDRMVETLGTSSKQLGDLHAKHAQGERKHVRARALGAQAETAHDLTPVRPASAAQDTLVEAIKGHIEDLSSIHVKTSTSLREELTATAGRSFWLLLLCICIFIVMVVVWGIQLSRQNRMKII